MTKNGGEDDSGESNPSGATVQVKEGEAKLRRSVFRRSFSILGHLFHRTSREDFEKRLQYLSKEEAAVHTRLKRRSQTWRKLARGVLVYSVIAELLIVGVALISTRAPELTWQMRALRILPVFVFPVLASLAYSAFASYYRMRERKDQKTLDRLRNERQEKIDELKERTNFYLTQQLIQKYDSDPAAKEAAARVLASKLGAEAGLKLSLELQDNGTNPTSTKDESFDVGLAETGGLRRRVQHEKAAHNSHGELLRNAAHSEAPPNYQNVGPRQPMQVEYPMGKAGGGGGLVARLAAMLVGEDSTQCYALICANCHMHNGLARKEEFGYLTYYCPHCNHLNGSKDAIGGDGEKNEVSSLDPVNGTLGNFGDGALLTDGSRSGSTTAIVTSASDRSASNILESTNKED